MSYIGRSPNYGSAVSEQITGTNSAGPYALSYDSSTSGVVISLDGVVQRNSVDFNIVGTALTFTSTVASGIIINVVFTGLTLSFPTPSDGSVDSSTIVAGAVDDSHISGLAASKLTGTIADARFPATLPATSGVNLTALNATNLGSGTVPTARLGSGTASSSTFLRGDQTYAEAGGGAWTLIATQVLDNSSTTVDFTGLDATYDTIAMVVVNLNCASGLWLRVGDSGGIDSGGSDYMYHSQDSKSNSTSYQAIANGGQSYMILSDSSGANSSNGSGLSGIWYLSGIQTSNSYPLVHGHYTWTYTPHAQGGITVGMRVAQIDVDRVQFLCGSGNMVAGRITLYGIKHT